MTDYVPLVNYTHYSLQYGFSKPKELVKKCVENGYKACGITDYKSISGAVKFFQECKKAGIKPIIGCAFDDYILFAKNKNGWFDLIEIVSTEKFKQSDNLIKVDTHALPRTYYTNKEDVDLHRICLASKLKTDIPSIQKDINKAKEFKIFFQTDIFYLPSKEEAILDKRSIIISEQCEDYNILEKPQLPTFPTPNGETEEEYLKQLCRKGWKKLLGQTGKVKKEEVKKHYLERFQEEFGVIRGAKLFGYFLIVWDIINFVVSNGWIAGPGRGSAAGCLISYLIGITQVDPIEYDLLFSRFYNAGRNTEDHVSYPDVDIDVPGGKRDEIIAYLKNKYGHKNVSQMITFGRLQGRSALKEVLRINKACGFAEMNAMTDPIPDEADISDQLELMDEEDRSIIRWALINNPDELMQFCHIADDGSLKGDYAPYFEQAIRLEGTFKSQGKHAAGVVISKDHLEKVCPMLPQKGSDEKLAGLEMNDLEALGQIKFDVLGLALLDKLMKVRELKCTKQK